MAVKIKPIKDKVKAKAKAVKDKVKAKAKATKEKLKGGEAKKAVSLAMLCALSMLTGCMTPEQASRSTAATVGDVSIENKIEEIKGASCPCGDKACACADKAEGKEASKPLISIVSKISFGDMAMASADSAGSTESQTQTPTFDISPKTDLRYNDALAAASGTSKNILESLGSVLTDAGKVSLLSMIESKSTGTVTLDKKDGTKAVVKCENGQCTACTDCTPQ